mmetsp:Transcript_6578/g.10583  ORF Transcript_6578/g.10583 Transcript_6578/m.10583 type:complete len:96 (+) Transcript_6578:1027-1314(+)
MGMKKMWPSAEIASPYFRRLFKSTQQLPTKKSSCPFVIVMVIIMIVLTSLVFKNELGLSIESPEHEESASVEEPQVMASMMVNFTIEEEAKIQTR